MVLFGVKEMNLYLAFCVSPTGLGLVKVRGWKPSADFAVNKCINSQDGMSIVMDFTSHRGE